MIFPRQSERMRRNTVMVLYEIWWDRGVKLLPGMTLAIEPMINMGRADVCWLDDEWTVVTMDGSLSAHYENTILITDGEPEILTLTEY